MEPFRLFHNLLSSQPMCFNLFGPLVADRELARRLVDRLVPEEVAEVHLVDLEWAPEPAGDYLGDGTAFDAYIEYSTTGGQRCALGVETKLTEPFSPKVYDGQHYRRWMRGADSPWRAEAWDRVQARGHNQLWRDHLLAVALRDHPQRRIDGSRLLVLHHGLDRGCGRVLAGYRALLREGDASLMSRTLDALVGLWEPALDTDAERRWLQDFRLRYLDLHRSAGRTDPQ